MYITGEVKEIQLAKPEIIKYYNKTKGGVNTMDKMLAEYTVKRRTLRWPYAFFLYIIDITGLAPYIIYKEHNLRFRTKDQRRKFLKDLANQLCMPSVEAQSANRMLMRSHFLQSSVEMVLGRRILTQPKVADGPQIPHESHGATPIVGSCKVCRDQKKKQRKTKKSSVVYEQPFCDEHSSSKTTCVTCEN